MYNNIILEDIVQAWEIRANPTTMTEKQNIKRLAPVTNRCSVAVVTVFYDAFAPLTETAGSSGVSTTPDS